MLTLIETSPFYNAEQTTHWAPNDLASITTNAIFNSEKGKLINLAC